jgi:hypothetical protein
MKERKKFWLFPIVCMLLLFGMLFVFAQTQFLFSFHLYLILVVLIGGNRYSGLSPA